MKGGSSPEDVYRTFMTGLEGSPMPSYEGAMTEEEAWELVAYVRGLFLDLKAEQESAP
jgi:mono/diheme cytochrome c family protein